MKIQKNKAFLVSVLLTVKLTVYGQQATLPEQRDRWFIQPDGSITWPINGQLPHADHIEMSGEKVSLWIEYGVDTSGILNINRTVVFPTFRTLPDNTRSHISYTFRDNELPRFYINNRLLRTDLAKSGRSGDMGFRAQSINHKGIMRISAQAGNPPLVKIERSLFPSVTQPMAIEEFKFTNSSDKALTVSMEYLDREVTTDTLRSKGGPHTVIMRSVNQGRRTLQPGQTTTFSVCYLATDHPASRMAIDVNAEEKARVSRVAEILLPLQ